jgi:hypothetical protein
MMSLFGANVGYNHAPVFIILRAQPAATASKFSIFFSSLYHVFEYHPSRYPTRNCRSPVMPSPSSPSLPHCTSQIIDIPPCMFGPLIHPSVRLVLTNRQRPHPVPLLPHHPTRPYPIPAHARHALRTTRPRTAHSFAQRQPGPTQRTTDNEVGPQRAAGQLCSIVRCPPRGQAL